MDASGGLDSTSLAAAAVMAALCRGSTFKWSCKSMAERSALSKSTIGRIWRDFGLKPHRADSVTLSTLKIVDAVGLYRDKPERAVVLCVDEKSQTRPWAAHSPCCR